MYALHVGTVFGFTQRQLNPARCKKRLHAVVTRFAVDVAQVVGIDIERHERLARSGRPFLKKPIEQFLPRRRVHARRPGQHPVGSNRTTS